MSTSEIFGAIVGAVMLLTLLSGQHVLQKVGLLLMLAWAGSNLAVNYMGFERAPLIVPSLDAAIALGIALVGFRHKSKTALAIVVLYVLVGVVHVLSLILRMQETYTYYAALNILFLAQLLILGGSGAWVAVRSRALGGHQRPGLGPPRRPHLG